MNDEEEFDARIREALGGYVYALRHPRDRAIFYVGKAGGWDAQGNDRVLSHFAEARYHRDHPHLARSAKVQRIIETWQAGYEVEWFVVRRGLTEAEAFHVEAALIDLLRISSAPDALNAINGIRREEHGPMSAAQVRLLAAPRLGADGIPAALVGRPILIFNIQNALTSKRDPDAYGATRRAWKLGRAARRLDDAIAVGLGVGISHGAWEIDSWVPDALNADRWCFEGHEPTDAIRPHLWPRNFRAIIGHDSVRGYWLRGNPIAIELAETGAYRVIRGSSDHEWHSLLTNCLRTTP